MLVIFITNHLLNIQVHLYRVFDSHTPSNSNLITLNKQPKSIVLFMDNQKCLYVV
jgi:hypothetical protein